MPKFIKAQPRHQDDVARQVVKGLAEGPAVIPLLGGYCLIGLSPAALERVGDVHRLVCDFDRLGSELVGMEGPYRELVLKVMAGPVVGRFGPGDERSQGQESFPTSRSQGQESFPTSRSQGQESFPTSRSQGQVSSPTSRSQGQESSPTSRSQGQESSPTSRSQGQESFPTSGVAVASEPLAQAIVRQVGEGVWFAVPEDETEPGELARELGSVVSGVVAGGYVGPGPTVVDFRARPAVVERRGKLAIVELEQQLGELVRMGPGLYFSVLVLCTGNSCRSPMAQVMLAGMLDGVPVFVGSAGTTAPVGNPATPFAVTAMRELGLDLSRQRARQLDGSMIRAADLILAMEKEHRDRVLELAPEAAGRTRLLLSYVGPEDKVEDPYGMSIEVYRRVLDKMRPALERVAAEVKQRQGRAPSAQVQDAK